MSEINDLSSNLTALHQVPSKWLSAVILFHYDKNKYVNYDRPGESSPEEDCLG